MVFSSLLFLYFFLPASIILYFLAPGMRMKNLVLLIFSLIFYAWGEPVWIILLLISSVVDFFLGTFIDKYRGRKASSWLLGASVLVNLSLLMTFKYADFFTFNFNYIFGTSLPLPGITLPIGISFYTFQTLSYSIDVYRNQIPVQRSFLNYMVYVSMFPQLVAGPIVRYSEVVGDIDKRSSTWPSIMSGANRFCLGLFKKVFIANTASILVDKYLELQFFHLSSPEAWFGIVMFSVQIYFDFSGYSDMAIGMGRIFGFHFLENFKHPYAAISVADFYKRWHMSLGRFFRDYVYIPLGGNRRHQYRNIMVVWLLTGFWHGASWNFVLWGAFFGCFMIIEKWLEKPLERTPRLLRHTYTLILIVFSRAIFYFVDFEDLKFMLVNLFHSSNAVGVGFMGDLTGYAYFFILVIMFCIPWNELYPPETRMHQLAARFYNFSAPAINVVFILLCTVMLADSTYNPFIYFRF
jgi:alginate O-acetyltransferase complex protein AlgI